MLQLPADWIFILDVEPQIRSPVCCSRPAMTHLALSLYNLSRFITDHTFVDGDLRCTGPETTLQGRC